MDEIGEKIQRYRLNKHESYDSTNLEILKGNFNALPERVSSEVRVFISSIHKDFDLERNYLMENVYDELRTSCLEKYQKDLLIIDMKWGVTDEFLNQKKTLQICFNEILKCQNELIGPSFVALIGNRYGQRTFKHSIKAEEFNLVRTELRKAFTKDMSRMFEYCYEFENNSQEYKLNTIKTEKWEWKMYEEKLLKCIRKTVEGFSKSAKISKTQRDSYLTSILDQEIQIGLLNEKKSRLKTLAFFREFENADPNFNSEELKSYRENDLEAKILLNELKFQVRKKLTIPNKYVYQIEWSKANNFKEPYTDSLKAYLKKFSDDFKFSIKLLLQWNIEAIGTLKDDSELLNHARICFNLQNFYINRPTFMKKIKYYLNDELENKPFVVAGASGCGKSTLLAYLVKDIKDEDPDCIVIIRFMGTTRESSTIMGVFNSLINHLQAIFKNDIRRDHVDECENIFELRNILLNLFQQISERYPKQKLVIILDSIDQLSIRDYSLDWLFIDLPENFKLIFSVQSNYQGMFEVLKHKLDYVVLEQLDFIEAKELFEVLLKESNRNLSSKQWIVVNTLLNTVNEIYPMHIKLLCDITQKWSSSYVVTDDFYKCINIKQTIKYLIKNYEKTFGEVLFSRCMFYITYYEYRGISEAELQDILSIDDDVLTSIYQNHHPTVRRFPIALWLNIKYEIKDYLIEKDVDNMTVISWSNKIFIEAIHECYESMFIASELRDRLLMNIIDYFTERWNKIKSNGKTGDQKVFEYKKKRLNKFQLKQYGKRLDYFAYRNTRIQPLRFKRKLDDKVLLIYNERTLNELPRAINMIHSNTKKVELLKRFIYFNVDFMRAKAELHEMDFIFELDETLQNLRTKFPEDAVEMKELLDIHEIYKNNYRKIQNSPKKLAFEVLGRFSSRSYYIKNFSLSCGLMPIQSFMRKEPVKDVFSAYRGVYIVNYYFLSNRNYLFVETKSRDDSVTYLCLVNMHTKKLIGQLDFEMKADTIQICIFNNASTLKTLETMISLKGYVYFKCMGYVYLITFFNEILTVIKLSDDIKDILLLNSNTLLAVLPKSLVLLDLKENREMASVKQKIVENDTIELFKSNLKQNEAFIAETLNNLEIITLVVGLKNKNVKIYQFRNNSENRFLNFCCNINNLTWDPYSFGIWIDKHMVIWRESLILDESSLIDNFKNENSLKKVVRFAVEGDGVVNVVEVLDDGSYSLIDRIDKNNIVEMKNKEAKVELIRFFSNKILLNVKKVSLGTCLMVVYDLETRDYLKLDNLTNVYYIDYIPQPSILAVIEASQLSLLEIGETNIEGLTRMKIDMSNIRLKENKFLAISDRGQSIIEIDYSINNKTDTSKPIYIKRILYQFDLEHILVECNRDNAKEFAILNTITQTKLKSIVMAADYLLLGVNKQYFVLYDKSECLIHLYKIEQVKLDFTLLLKSRVQTDENESKKLNGSCFFDDTKNPQKIFIELYKQEFDSFEIKCISTEKNNPKCDSFIVNISEVDLDRTKMKRSITSLNNYLVLWEDYKSQIYFFDIFNNKLLMKKYFSIESQFDYISNVNPIQNSNDFLVKLKSSIYTINFNKYTNEVREQKIKDFKTENFQIVLENNYLIVDLIENIEIYRFDEFLKGMRADFRIKNKEMKSYCFSNSHFILFTSNLELCVYRLNNTIEQTACFNMNQNLDNLFASEKYINAKCDNKLLAFELIYDEFSI